MRLTIPGTLVVVVFVLGACGGEGAAAGRPPQLPVRPRPTWTPASRPIDVPRTLPVSTPSATPQDMTLPAASFGFIFTYGVCVLSRADTFAGTFNRYGDGIDPPVTVPLSFTADDLPRIQRDMHQIDFFSYPTDFSINPIKDGLGTMVTPSASYIFQVREGDRQKTVRWQDNVIRPTSQKADDLRELAGLIERTVHGSPAVAALPPLHVGCA